MFTNMPIFELSFTRLLLSTTTITQTFFKERANYTTSSANITDGTSYAVP